MIRGGRPAASPGGRGRGHPRRIVLDLVLAVAILLLLLFVVARFQDPVEVRAGMAMIADGDSITIGQERIRLVGIDAPELAQTCRREGTVYPCGREAREALRRLAGDGFVTCRGGERDRYGRMLALCRVGDVDITRARVEEGWAVAYGDFADEEAAARARRVGLWAGEFDRPREWRAVHGEPADLAPGWAARLWSRLWSLLASLFP